MASDIGFLLHISIKHREVIRKADAADNYRPMDSDAVRAWGSLS